MYSLKFHKNLTPEKWAQFTGSQQILMIANELNRAKNRISEPSEVNNCYERAFELIDLTIAVTENENLLFELLRFREVFAGLYLNEDKYPEENSGLFKVLVSLNSESYNALN